MQKNEMENDNEQDAMKKGCTEEAIPKPLHQHPH